MTLTAARIKAKALSRQYGMWYVREVTPGNYQPYAHSSDDTATVACFMNGKEFKGD